jgi:predicted transcriptional regulator
MECNFTVQYLCNDEVRQKELDDIFSSAFDDKADIEERVEQFDPILKEAMGKVVDDFPELEEAMEIGASLEKRKTGFSAFYFLMSNSAYEFEDEIKMILEQLGADKVKCRADWV